MVLICASFLVFQPAFGAPGASPIGTVSSRGLIRVNGVPAPAGTEVYAGNLIVTSQGASGYIRLAHGGKIVLGASTVARVTHGTTGFAVLLDHGVVGAVSDASSPIIVEAGGVTVLPRRSSGAYEVELLGTKIRVLSRRGVTMAEAANQTVEVGEGKLMKAAVAFPQPPSHKHKVLAVVLTGVAIAGVGIGVALAYPGKTCQSVSPSAFTCR